jgi:rhodanese-related sulfurtransferase
VLTLGEAKGRLGGVLCNGVHDMLAQAQGCPIYSAYIAKDRQMKSAMDYLEAANATVPKMEAKDAIAKHAAGQGVFVDVRDTSAINESGTIQGAHRVPRGMIEFRADPKMEAFYNPIFAKDAEIYLICGAGGQAALSGKTLQDMGFTNVTNIGGFAAWKEAGGPTEA